MGDLTRSFSKEELKCKCGCGTFAISFDFLNRLQMARDLAGVPFTINSGCRCAKHNKEEKGKKDSDHLVDEGSICEGADVACNNGSDRWKIVKASIESGITRIGIAETFIHLGIKKSNPQNVIWLY